MERPIVEAEDREMLALKATGDLVEVEGAHRAIPQALPCGGAVFGLEHAALRERSVENHEAVGAGGQQPPDIVAEPPRGLREPYRLGKVPAVEVPSHRVIELRSPIAQACDVDRDDPAKQRPEKGGGKPPEPCAQDEREPGNGGKGVIGMRSSEPEKMARGH